MFIAVPNTRTGELTVSTKRVSAKRDIGGRMAFLSGMRDRGRYDALAVEGACARRTRMRRTARSRAVRRSRDLPQAMTWFTIG